MAGSGVEFRPALMGSTERNRFGTHLMGKLTSGDKIGWRTSSPYTRNNFSYEPFRTVITLGGQRFGIEFSQVEITREGTDASGKSIFSEPKHTIYKVDVVNTRGSSNSLGIRFGRATVLRINDRDELINEAEDLYLRLYDIPKDEKPFRSYALREDLTIADEFYAAFNREFPAEPVPSIPEDVDQWEFAE